MTATHGSLVAPVVAAVNISFLQTPHLNFRGQFGREPSRAHSTWVATAPIAMTIVALNM
jgi:hypothetical protein